jgi:hypothetical protein
VDSVRKGVSRREWALALSLIFFPVSYCLLNPEIEKRKKGKMYKEQEKENAFQFQFFPGFSQLLAWSCRNRRSIGSGGSRVEMLIRIYRFF